MSGRKACQRYLFHFANEHVEFRLPEFHSIASLFGIDYTFEDCGHGYNTPFLIVHLPSEEDAKKITSRSILTKSVSELWGHGKTYVDLYRSVRDYPSELKAPYFSSSQSFKINVDTFNRTIQQEEKIQKIENLPYDIFDFKGKVKMKNPDNCYNLNEYYGEYAYGQPDQPYHIYFGRQVDVGQRDLVRHYHLQKRHFIANTSMDAKLSLIMANIGKVKENDLVFDPFVGSGSLLVACAHHRAYVMGTDIDYLLLYGKAKPTRSKIAKRDPDESIRSNLRQYNLEQYYIDALVADSSRHELWDQRSYFDAIITDPPYGIREQTKKIGTDKEDLKLTEENKIGHVAQKKDYHLGDIFKDLLNFAAKFLQMNSRLVYWFPVYRPEYTEENIPTHPCLKLVYNSEQIMSTYISRRLIAMEKIKEYEIVTKTEPLYEGHLSIKSVFLGFLGGPNTQEVDAHIEVDLYQDASFRDKYYSNSKDETITKTKNINTSRETESNSQKDFKTKLESDTDFKTGSDSETDYKTSATSETVSKSPNFETDYNAALNTERTCKTSNSETESETRSNFENDYSETDCSKAESNATNISQKVDSNQNAGGNR